MASSWSAPSHAIAAPLTGTAVSLSKEQADTANVTYAFLFTTATSETIKEIGLSFKTTEGGNVKPAGLNLASATLGSTSNIGSGWSLDTSAASTGLISLTRAVGIEIPSATIATIEVASITNPSLRDCNNAGTTLSDTCYISITTYSDSGTTAVDTAVEPFMIVEDASLSFEVAGVASGQTHNGITTSVSSSPSALPFGVIQPGGVKYAAHELRITTNAPGGYKVYAHLEEPITGKDIRNSISPFGATDATWETPQAWMTPTGTGRSSNSGWFAANTTDARVTGWSSASGKLGPISTTPHIVAQSTGSDREGSVIYVTYALGVNYTQAADVYSGTVFYDIQAIY
jgi:hypothetical protein